MKARLLLQAKMKCVCHQRWYDLLCNWHCTESCNTVTEAKTSVLVSMGLSAMQDQYTAGHESPAQSNPASAGDTDSNGLEDTKGELQHGCEHYRRRCKLVAPCCGEVFWCRHCHNDAKSDNEVVRQSALSADTPNQQQQCLLMYSFLCTGSQEEA